MGRKRNFFESHNPVMKESAYKEAASTLVPDADTMTVSGAVNKTLILGAIMLLLAALSYSMPSPIFTWGGAIGGLVVVLIAAFKPQRSPVLAPIYAAFEGLFVGGITAIYGSMFGGIVFNAITLTVAIFFLMLFLYKTGTIKVTQKLRSGVIMATGAIALVYVASFVLSFFGIQVPFLHEASIAGIGISLLIIGVAAMNLLLDFDNFEKGEQYQAPAYMEWFSAMGLLITLIWLYVEILRLLALLSSSD